MILPLEPKPKKLELDTPVPPRDDKDKNKEILPAEKEPPGKKPTRLLSHHGMFSFLRIRRNFVSNVCRLLLFFTEREESVKASIQSCEKKVHEATDAKSRTIDAIDNHIRALKVLFLPVPAPLQFREKNVPGVQIFYSSQRSSSAQAETGTR